MTTKHMTRREILRLGVSTAVSSSLSIGGGLTLFGSGVSDLLARTKAANAMQSSSKNTLVVVFMRGAVDGLSILAPYSEAAYYRDRPGISLAKPPTALSTPEKKSGLIAMNETFGLHPSLSALKTLYDSDDLAFVHAIGSPTASRSHFDAQDQMEVGSISLNGISGGWLNRALSASLSTQQLSQNRNRDFFAGVAIGSSMPRILTGKAETISLSSVDDLRLNKKHPFSVGLHALYEKEGSLHDSGLRALRAVDTLQMKIPKKYQPENGAKYNKKTKPFRELARVLKAGLGVEAVVVDFGGWDTHAGQGAAKGRLSNKLSALAQGLSNFHKDMGEANKHITIVTISEFGRTVAQNGSGGTDHGHGTVMMAMGGGVNGGKIYGRWPGIEPEQRYQGRDLAVTTDYRQFLSELLQKRWQQNDTQLIFPNFTPPKTQLGIFS